MLCPSHYAACVVKPDNTVEVATLGLLTFFFSFSEMRLNSTTHLQMVLGPVFVDDQVLTF